MMRLTTLFLLAMLSAGCATSPVGKVYTYTVAHVDDVRPRLSSLRSRQPRSSVLAQLGMQDNYCFGIMGGSSYQVETYLLLPHHALEIYYSLDLPEHPPGEALFFRKARITQPELARELSRGVKNGTIELIEQPDAEVQSEGAPSD